ncbi:LytR/AlgR family response regulator transcription factor [Dyadobacter pollutisoli]|uniref:LytTR family DNA-binding domain-containing protein n=1 Tax=Dyadobacter pollutisoli TaxID=2910158 RepID=A0A9E8NF90_9BACT|nr:LytTR family DNA-binding domain-containing protein [Dyadobacter pollutisoli]WAC14873.1 LytTR family DNA-binding domain-containing protein [Dyadobacter pollutisoli]
MINCIAVDDEFLALEIIENYVSKCPFLELVTTFSSPLEALPLLNSGKCDLLLLDINMPDVNGLDFLNAIQNPPLVILTTAYPQFALAGFEADVVDYLVKPFSFERFLKAIQKAQIRLGTTAENTPDYLFIRSAHRMVRVDLEDILMVEGKKDYVAVHTWDQVIETLMTLTALLERLPAKDFIRVHRSFIVALNKITSIERNIIYIGDQKVPIGDLFRDELLRRIG